jgi:phasin family protein
MAGGTLPHCPQPLLDNGVKWLNLREILLQMAETDDTTGIVAAAQSASVDALSNPVTGKSALRRKVVGRGQTSLSSPARIVLPGDVPVVPVQVAKPDPDAAASAAPQAASPTVATASAAENAPAVENADAGNTAPIEGAAPAKRPIGRARKVVPVSAPLAAGAKRPLKSMPVEPVAAKPTHAKLPPVAHVTAPSSAPTGKAAAGHAAAATRPAPRASRITKPVPTPSANPSSVSSIKDMTMDMSANFSGFQDAVGQAQAKAQAAFEKSSNMLGEAGDFAKGNAEAMVEAGKIFAEGVQQIGSAMAADGRTAFETMTGDIKDLAAAKSPTDFLKLQSDLVRKNFDNAVAYGSKNSETFLKLMSDAFAPLSGRMSLAMEKARQVAPVATSMNVAA